MMRPQRAAGTAGLKFYRSFGARVSAATYRINSFPDTENESRRILRRWRHRAVDILSQHLGYRVYSDTIQVVRWDGLKMPPHQDDRHPDGAPHNTPWRVWASVIYLNDNFEGGEIYFPETGESYQPLTGSLIIFEGRLRHGVEQ
jgi:hypothetical protein